MGSGGAGAGSNATNDVSTGANPTVGPSSSSGGQTVSTTTTTVASTSTDSPTASSSSTGVVACGAPGEACCAGDLCDAEATCNAGTCALTCVGCGTTCEAGACIASTLVTAGHRFGCALLGTGSIRCWGANDDGELGDGTMVGRWQPMPLAPPIADVVTIASAPTDQHSCALTTSGTVWCWGANYLGQLGDGTTDYPYQAVQVQGLPQPAVEVKVGGEGAQGKTCARLVDGTVWCWGKPNVLVPAQVMSVNGATHIAVGGWHACAIVNGGQVSCWGLNTSGQLGNGNMDPAAGAVTVSGITNATSLALGRVHSCAVLTDGTARCWGDNTVSQLGIGPAASDVPTATAVVGLAGVTKMAAGGGHTCAILSDGTARCWGDNILGQLGIGSFDGKLDTPQNVLDLAGATTIATGSFHTCATVTDGRVYCWGYNQGNQLGSPGNSWSVPHLVEWQ